MRSNLALVLTVTLVTGCCGRGPATTPPPPTGDDAHCTAPRPGPDATCVQDCGPPVVRDGDPPPPWRWLTPEEVAQREQGGCPRCLPADATIATPAGDVAITALTVGTPVWSLDGAGHRVAVPVLRVASRPTPADHTLVVLVLADGRQVTASAGHPTADGRPLGALATGDRVDGAAIVAIRHRPYGDARTWDLLPAGPTRAYWADGVLLTSTLGTGSGVTTR